MWNIVVLSSTQMKILIVFQCNGNHVLIQMATKHFIKCILDRRKKLYVPEVAYIDFTCGLKTTSVWKCFNLEPVIYHQSFTSKPDLKYTNLRVSAWQAESGGLKPWLSYQGLWKWLCVYCCTDISRENWHSFFPF